MRKYLLFQSLQGLKRSIHALASLSSTVTYDDRDRGREAPWWWGPWLQRCQPPWSAKAYIRVYGLGSFLLSTWVNLNTPLNIWIKTLNQTFSTCLLWDGHSFPTCAKSFVNLYRINSRGCFWALAPSPLQGQLSRQQRSSLFLQLQRRTRRNNKTLRFFNI